MAYWALRFARRHVGRTSRAVREPTPFGRTPAVLRRRSTIRRCVSINMCEAGGLQAPGTPHWRRPGGFASQRFVRASTTSSQEEVPFAGAAAQRDAQAVLDALDIMTTGRRRRKRQLVHELLVSTAAEAREVNRLAQLAEWSQQREVAMREEKPRRRGGKDRHSSPPGPGATERIVSRAVYAGVSCGCGHGVGNDSLSRV